MSLTSVPQSAWCHSLHYTRTRTHVHCAQVPIIYAHMSKICFIVFSVCTTQTMHSIIHHFPSCTLLSQFNNLNILQSHYKTTTNHAPFCRTKNLQKDAFVTWTRPLAPKKLRRSFDLPQDSSLMLLYLSRSKSQTTIPTVQDSLNDVEKQRSLRHNVSTDA